MGKTLGRVSQIIKYCFIVVALVVLILNHTISYAEILPSNSIRINEISPYNTDTYGEYLELYNFGDDVIDINNWQLEYAYGSGYRNCLISLSNDHIEIADNKTDINPHDFVLIKFKKEYPLLRDDNGWVALLDQSGTVISNKAEYSEGKKGYSYSLLDGDWQWSNRQTPNSENLNSIIESDIENNYIQNNLTLSAIKDVRKKEIGEKVKIEGIVTAIPGDISNNVFYVQDNDAGIQIYSYYKDFPLIKHGDQVEVTGEIASYFNEERVKISQKYDVVIKKSDNTIFPLLKNISEITEELEGMYIEVNGVVTSSSGSEFLIIDSKQSKEIKVLVKNQSIVNKPKLSKGMTVKVSGIISQYKDYYRILPFKEDGVTIVVDNLPVSGFPYLENIILLILILEILCYIILKVKMKQLRSQMNLLRL